MHDLYFLLSKERLSEIYNIFYYNVPIRILSVLRGIIDAFNKGQSLQNQFRLTTEKS